MRRTRPLLQPTSRRVPSGHRARPRIPVRTRVHGTYIVFAVLGGIYGLALPAITGVDPQTVLESPSLQPPAVTATR